MDTRRAPTDTPATPSVATVAPLAADATLPQEWQALDDCHREVLSTLQDLQQLCLRIEAQGVDPAARTLAQGIVGFFSQAARQHHADEERLVFPALLTSGDAVLVQHVRRLQQDHGWLEEDWLELAPQLEAIAQGYNWYDLDMLRHALPVFTSLYLEHIDLEESLIYPQAKRRLQPNSVGPRPPRTPPGAPVLQPGT